LPNPNHGRIIDPDMVLRDLAKRDKTFLQFLSTNKKPEKPNPNSFGSL
jgi:hypothetical protein